MADPISRRDLDFPLVRVARCRAVHRSAALRRPPGHLLTPSWRRTSRSRSTRRSTSSWTRTRPYVGDDGKVVLPDATADGVREFLAAGLIAGPFGEELDGGSLPPPSTRRR